MRSRKSAACTRGRIRTHDPAPTAKAALFGFARSLARELGPSGVTVNSVAPGLIDTDITQGKLDEERRAAMIADVPVRRIGSVGDVAGHRADPPAHGARHRTPRHRRTHGAHPAGRPVLRRHPARLGDAGRAQRCMPVRGKAAAGGKVPVPSNFLTEAGL
ncbi:SDR family oxidoreductase [Streptomyces sp. S.PB5]|uniref:SDR family oxidoreductase n=1 Tax=Streptomyces sp. S.PB5 TaxID=3020844 RepID=UPI0025AF5068|nr:SDR family oxidoreductase [Streptomyces sp. S.PB5]MDN3029086.1 SDR family oxidoreductase [Streptomyces sp. S.PB5]